MDEKVDYINLIDIAKINLNNCINATMEIYKIQKDSEIKEKLIALMYDRNKIFLFDKETIKKYL